MFLMSKSTPGRGGGWHLRRRGCIGESHESEARSGMVYVVCERGVLEVNRGIGRDVYAKDLQ